MRPLEASWCSLVESPAGNRTVGLRDQRCQLGDGLSTRSCHRWECCGLAKATGNRRAALCRRRWPFSVSCHHRARPARWTQVPGIQRVLSRAVPHLENCTSLLTTLLGWALSASDPRLISVITCKKKQVHRPNGKFQSREDTDATFGNGASTAGTA